MANQSLHLAFGGSTPDHHYSSNQQHHKTLTITPPHCQIISSPSVCASWRFLHLQAGGSLVGLGIWSGCLLDISLGGVLGVPIVEETLGQTKKTLKRLYLLASLGTSWCPLGGGGGSGERPELPAQAVAPATRTRLAAEIETKTKTYQK